MPVRYGERPSKQLATPTELSEYLAVPEKTLTQWRWLGTGPRWSKVGRHVRYRWTDIERWLDQQARGGSAA
ncbi:helix-turn-helix transcriptional regulator [Microbispora bryophytorum]|uniref:helix-turn-helix transcriptional regulator n=1 Tax=Microbispora bryophytorum TaxID=1460882 RepID=UPI0033EB7ABC